MPEDPEQKSLPPRPEGFERAVSSEGGRAVAPARETGDAAGLEWEMAALRGRLREAEDELLRLREHDRSRLRLLELMEMQGDLLAAHDPGFLITRILEMSMGLVGAERAALFRLDSRGALTQAQSLPPDSNFTDMSKSLVRDALLSRSVRYYLGGEGLRGRERRSIVDLGLGTVLAAPLLAEDKLLGALYLDGRAVGQFGAPDLPVLESFTRQAALALLRLEELRQARSEGRRLEVENQELRDSIRSSARFGRFLAESPAMQRVVTQLRRMAMLRTTVRLQGETGTGKELIARALHEESPWSDAPFVAINCGAIPEALLEGELFGYVRGAFTGADVDRMGLFEKGDGGTIFLDEVGDMPVTLQVKLLRVLEEGEVRRLGENRDRKVDFRLVVASNQDLERRVMEGSFREDLFYRINVLTVRIPPLRQRSEDILALAEHFLRVYSKSLGLDKPRLSRASARRLLDYPWPGNVRQLEKCIERSLALWEGSGVLEAEQIIFDDGPLADLGADRRDETLKAYLRRMEREKIVRVLDECGGKVVTAARVLGIARQTLHEKIRSLEIR